MSVFLEYSGVASEKIHKSQGTQVWTCLNLPVKKKKLQFFVLISDLGELVSVILLMARVPVSPS